MIDYEKKFVFEILMQQIRAVISDWGKPVGEYPLKDAATHYWNSITSNGVMHIGDVKLPDIRFFQDWNIWPTIYGDSLLIYHLFNDNYAEATVKMCEDWGLEGPYGFNDIKVKKSETVIDAGGYIGDSAAQFAAVGADVYSFDPSPRVFKYLEHSAKMNGFTAINQGLARAPGDKRILYKEFASGDVVADTGNAICELTTVDNFANDNSLKIDFIKADIEGYEEEMLRGAVKTLQCDQPKLAIKTYHKVGDPLNIPRLILETNPKYYIVNRPRTVYAYVP